MLSLSVATTPWKFFCFCFFLLKKKKDKKSLVRAEIKKYLYVEEGTKENNP